MNDNDNNTARSDKSIGMFIDVANFYRNGGRRLRYDALRRWVCRRGEFPSRLNAYVTVDNSRMEVDKVYRTGIYGFHSKLREYGFRVYETAVRWYTDDTGQRYGKANADMLMAIHGIGQGARLDTVILGSGDGDFVPLVEALQSSGTRVELLGLRNVSRGLVEAVDSYTNGYLVPGVVPTMGSHPSQPYWGLDAPKVGMRVRGTCYRYDRESGCGYFKFLEGLDTCGDLWIDNPTSPRSAWRRAFFTDSDVERPEKLPSPRLVFEFTLGEAVEDGGEFRAVDVQFATDIT